MQSSFGIEAFEKNKMTASDPAKLLTLMQRSISVSAIWDFLSDSAPCSVKCSPVSIPFISLWTPSFIKRQPTDWDKRPSRKLDTEVPPASLKASASNRPSNPCSYQRYLPLGAATCACVCERDLAKEQAPLYTSICGYVHTCLCVCECVNLSKTGTGFLYDFHRSFAAQGDS